MDVVRSISSHSWGDFVTNQPNLGKITFPIQLEFRHPPFLHEVALVKACIIYDTDVMIMNHIYQVSGKTMHQEM